MKWIFFFLSLQRNLSLEFFFFCRCKEICRWNPILSLRQVLAAIFFFLWNAPRVYLLHGQVVTVVVSQKLEGSRSSRSYRMRNILNQLCMQNLEIIYGNTNKILPKKIFLPLRVNVLHFRKFTLRQKYPTTTENLQVRKIKYTCPILMELLLLCVHGFLMDRYF